MNSRDSVESRFSLLAAVRHQGTSGNHHAMRYGWYYALGVIASSLRGIRADSLDSLEISTFEQQASTPALPTTVETVAPTATATAPAELPSVSSEPPREDATVTQQAQSSETPSSEAAQGAVTPSADLPGTATPTPDPSEQAETPTSAVPTSSTATSAETREATPVSSVTETVATPQPSSPPPLVEEVPLVEIPPAPELPSFQEWRDRYVVQLDPAGARRSRKAAQRVRQDAVGAAALGAGGAVYDGDGADLGSLFVIGDEGSVVRPAEPNRGAETRAAPLEPGGTDGSAYRHSQHASPRGHEVQPATSDMASPLQPVPNVGVGDESDPLVHLKDRSNYAAFECAAMVHRSSRQSKGASSILVEKKDRYMLTPCSANPKFVDVELCDEIQIDTIVLANFEYFSSTFKHFKASCSVDYPGKSQDWHDLGTYRANNARGVQASSSPFAIGRNLRGTDFSWASPLRRCSARCGTLTFAATSGSTSSRITAQSTTAPSRFSASTASRSWTPTANRSERRKRSRRRWRRRI